MPKMKSQKYNNFYNIYRKDIEIKKVKERNWLYFLGIVIFWLLAGLVNQNSSRTFYVLFPYYFIFLPIIYFGYGMINFSSLSKNIDEAAFYGSIRRIHRSGLGIIVFTGVTILLDIIYIIFNFKTTNLRKEMCFCILLSGILVVGVSFAKFYNKYYTNLKIKE